MPAQKRNKTDYAGVYFIWGTHRVSRKPEKIFYITYVLLQMTVGTHLACAQKERGYFLWKI